MKELVIATTNRGKLREIRELLAEFQLNITSLADYPEIPPVEEDGSTFEENAVKKTVTVGRLTGKLVMGEDSGLEVEALGNAPGIHSARFAGSPEKNAADHENNAKLLNLLQGLAPEKRRARYRCCAALAEGERLVGVVSGSCEGLIAEKEKGNNGFGYDPLFFVPSYQKTFGELESVVKARISHRAEALRKIKKLLQNFLQ